MRMAEEGSHLTDNNIAEEKRSTAMQRIITFILLMTLCIAAPSQTGSGTKKRSTAKKTATTTKRNTSTAKKGSKQKATKKTATKTKKGKAAGKAKTPTNASIRGLESKRAEIRKNIKTQEAVLKKNKESVKKGLQNLMLLTSDIETRRKSIDSINHDITGIEKNIGILEGQLATLNQQLADRQKRYVKAMRYMSRHNTIQDQLMFIFSAESMAQMYRRSRFVREYAAHQKKQGEQIKAKQEQIREKQEALRSAKDEKDVLLKKGQKAHAELMGKQTEQQNAVKKLQKQQKTIQSIIDEQKKKDAELNKQIEKEIAKEVERIRKRAEEEARRKAAEEEAARKKAAEEMARKKAEAERRAAEQARRVAAAKEAERKAKAEAEAAAKKNAAERRAAEQRAREAEAERIAAERKATVERERDNRELAEAKKKNETRFTLSDNDRLATGGFEKNRGRLPMPVTGPYRIVSHFGQYSVEGLPNVHLDNKGINIMGSAGCAARSVFDGEVSAIFGYGGQMVVMVRHGQYISVYCNLSSVSVSRGQKVAARQTLGMVGNDNILQFQLRKGKAKLNPEQWLGR